MDAFGGAVPLLNYAQFQGALRIEFGRARRYGFPLSCALLAIDQLDALKGLHGVGARDQILSRCVGRLQVALRSSDLLAQFHDRFAFLLPHASGAGAAAAAERFRAAVAAESVEFEGTRHRLTASVGIATLESRQTLFFDSLWKGAEAALQQALVSGGNRIQGGAPGGGEGGTPRG